MRAMKQIARGRKAMLTMQTVRLVVAIIGGLIMAIVIITTD